MKAIQKIILDGSTTQVNLIDNDAVEVHHVPLAELPFFLIELAVTDKGIDAAATATITHSPEIVQAIQDVKTALAGIGLDATTAGVFATTFCGDTRDEITAMSDSVLNAIAKLLRESGFKSKAFDGRSYTGNLTCVEWLEGFRYGFIRASDEKLQQELEGMLQPEIGAW
jgi:hypothetical protein